MRPSSASVSSVPLCFNHARVPLKRLNTSLTVHQFQLADGAIAGGIDSKAGID